MSSNNRKTKNRSNSIRTEDKAPLLITIAPHCGKKTYLKNLVQNGVDEVSIDDIPQLYEKVPVVTFLKQLDLENDYSGKIEASEPSNIYADKNTYGVSIFSRISDMKDTEQGLLSLLFTGACTFKDIEVPLRSALPEKIIEAYISVVKKAIKNNETMVSKTIDINIAQAMTYATQTAKSSLRDMARSSDKVVVWSNTNLFPDQFADILAIAVQTKRPLRFIRWGYELPKVSFEELIERNISTFLSTGRYIPSEIIYESMEHSSNLLAESSTHEAIAYAAGYSMDSNGMLKKVNNAGPFTPSEGIKVYDGVYKDWFTKDVVAVLSTLDAFTDSATEKATGIDGQAEVKNPTKMAPVAENKAAPTPVVISTLPTPPPLSTTKGHDEDNIDSVKDKSQRMSEKERDVEFQKVEQKSTCCFRIFGF
mmetsp:Transcript_5429/g.5567  ORF Transcript_5429/g.5567 Transcript_5429/m.5567 type:complete len:422 (-) Transcript_5429:747-2012(-)